MNLFRDTKTALMFFMISLIFGGGNTSTAEPKTQPEFVQKAKQAQNELADAIQEFVPSFVFVQGGSGVLISKEGHFLTNYHVIAQIFKQDREQDKPVDRVINVERVGGESFKALVVGIDPGGDLALCKIVNTNQEFPSIVLGNSDQVSIGQSVIALGNPFLRGQFSARPIATFGMISAKHVFKRSYPDAIQTDAPINPGNSGGPLISLDGKLIGINGRIETKFGTRANSGVGYAISARRIKRFLPILKKGGIAFHGSLNLLKGEKISVDEGTITINKLDEDSKLFQAGLREGDQIISLGGYPVTSVRRLAGILQSYPGTESKPLTVTYKRNGVQKNTQLKLGQVGSWENDKLLRTLPTSEDAPFLGVGLKKQDEHLIITKVVKNSPAEQVGIQTGDVVLSINGRSVPTPEAAIRMIQSRWYGELISMTLKRSGNKRTIEATLGRREEN